MKKIRTIILIVGILMTGLASNAVAQKNKAARTSGAMAAYGYQPDDKHYKKMKKKSSKSGKKQKFAKRRKKSEDTGAAYRRRGFIM
jgi:hypothetical protein